MPTIRQQALLFSFLIALFFFVSRFITVNDTFLYWWTDISWTLFSGLAGWKCLQVARLNKSSRRIAWYYFAAANFSWFFGILIWDYLELIKQITTPFPAYSDIGFSIMAPLFILGIVHYQRDLEKSISSAIQFSKLGILVSCLLIIHIISFDEPIRQLNESLIYLLVALNYPILYLTSFIYALLFFWNNKASENSYVLLLLVLSIFTHAITDSIYAYSLLGKTYVVGNYIDVLWLIAFGFMYFSALQEMQLINRTTKDTIKYKAENITNNLDITITPIALFSLIIFVFVFYENIHQDTAPILLIASFFLVLFITFREMASANIEQNLKTSVDESENNFYDLTSSIPGITYQFLVSADGKRSFPYVSPNFSSFFDNTKYDIEQNAQLWIDKIHPDDLSNFEETVLISYQTMKPWYWEGRFLNTDQSYGWYRGNSIPRKLKDGSVLWNGIVTDITKYREEQIILSKDKNKLEEIVNERTEELIQAKDKAEQANEAKTLFLSHMSHELRTPLNAIIGFSQLLSLEELNDQQQDSVNEVLLAGNLLLNLINDLLDLSNIESGNIKTHATTVPIANIINTSVKLIQPLAIENNIEIEIIDDNLQEFVYVDEFKFRQILINLLSNAIKYNHTGGNVRISTEHTQDNMLKISIRDTGIGISEEKQNLVFEKFNRLGNEKTTIQGSGIGLSLSKILIQLMGGDIGFVSQPGNGTTFWVTCKRQNLNNIISNENPIKISKKILYIEDNDANIKLMKQICVAIDDTEFHLAKTAEEGITLAKQTMPQLILMDINLPGMDGYQALAELRSDPETTAIPIVAVTAAAFPSDREKGLKAGFSHYVTKPLKVMEVTSLIQKILF